jgi:hypothetical protein
MRRERGQALLETTLTVLVLIIFFFGLLEGARAVWQYNILAHAVREGTRYAIIHGSNSSDASGPGDTGDVEVVVRDAASTLDEDALTVIVNYPDGSNDPGDTVEVEARYQFSTMLPIVPLPSITMSSKSRMTIVN